MTTPPRTLAEALRARDDESLAGLLRARPDLLTPVPGDITQLATRAGTRASVVRALEHLDRFALQTAEALAVAPDPAPYDILLGLLTGDGRDDGEHRDDAGAAIVAALPGALATLREQALVWGRTTGCAWCAPPANCCRRPRSTPPPPVSGRPSPRPPPACRRAGSRKS